MDGLSFCIRFAAVKIEHIKKKGLSEQSLLLKDTMNEQKTNSA